MSATAVAAAVLMAACRAIVGIEDLSVADAGSHDAGNDVASEGAPAMPVTFTDDFDDGGTVNSGWDNVLGNVSLDNTLYASPPNSAKMVMLPVDSGVYVKSLMTKGFGIIASDALLSFDVHIEPGCMQTMSSVTLARIYFSPNYAVETYLTSNSTAVVAPLHVEEFVANVAGDPHPVASVSAGVGNDASFWHHVVMSVHVQPAANAAVTVAVDTDLDAATTYPLPLAVGGLEGGTLPPNVWLGLVSLAPHNSCRVNYDNVSITMTP